MNAVAAQAVDIALPVSTVLKVRMCRSVAGEALFGHNLGRGLAELKNLRHVPAAIHVRLAGAVAAFAGYAFAGMFQRQPRMRVVCEFFGNVRVTGLAGLRPDKLIGIARAWMGNNRLLWLRIRGFRACPGPDQQTQYETHSNVQLLSHLPLPKAGLKPLRPVFALRLSLYPDEHYRELV